MCDNKETLHYYIYIQYLRQEHFEIDVDYLFTGWFASFILKGKGIDLIFFPKVIVLK